MSYKLKLSSYPNRREAYSSRGVLYSSRSITNTGRWNSSKHCQKSYYKMDALNRILWACSFETWTDFKRPPKTTWGNAQKAQMSIDVLSARFSLPTPERKPKIWKNCTKPVENPQSWRFSPHRGDLNFVDGRFFMNICASLTCTQNVRFLTPESVHAHTETLAYHQIRDDLTAQWEVTHYVLDMWASAQTMSNCFCWVVLLSGSRI